MQTDRQTQAQTMMTHTYTVIHTTAGHQWHRQQRTVYNSCPVTAAQRKKGGHLARSKRDCLALWVIWVVG